MRKSVISGWARDDVPSGESMIASSYSTHSKDARRGEGEDARQDGSAASAGAQIGSWGAIHAALSIRRGGPLRSLSLRVTRSEGCQRIGVHVDTLRLLHPPFLRRGDRLIAIPTAECSWRVDWGNTNVVHRGASGDRPAVTLVERLVMSIQYNTALVVCLSCPIGLPFFALLSHNRLSAVGKRAPRHLFVKELHRVLTLTLTCTGSGSPAPLSSR